MLSQTPNEIDGALMEDESSSESVSSWTPESPREMAVFHPSLSHAISSPFHEEINGHTKVPLPRETRPSRFPHLSAGVDKHGRAIGEITERPMSDSLHPTGISSYWSIKEQDEFRMHVARFGTDWDAISFHMGNKTPTMVKNMYFRSVEGGDIPDLIKAAYDVDQKRNPPRMDLENHRPGIPGLARGVDAQTTDDPFARQKKHGMQTGSDRPTLYMRYTISRDDSTGASRKRFCAVKSEEKRSESEGYKRARRALNGNG
jgi:hypothetical protein